ncbi:hypothetical protein MKX03_013314 [Papaver bracteatum]|nr:hypothetical protein MKX03_013314 [Papaver bracteatum]
MGFILVITLPFILFTILLGFGCFFFGRYKGRQKLLNRSQVFGVPTPPPHGADTSYPQDIKNEVFLSLPLTTERLSFSEQSMNSHTTIMMRNIYSTCYHISTA